MNKTRLTATTILLTAALLGSGCFLEIETAPVAPRGTFIDATPVFSDLRVTWSVNGSDLPSLCSAHGISNWSIELSGAERRTVSLDCRLHLWSTENDFFTIAAGRYTVVVRALDALGRTIGSAAATMDTLARGSLETLHLDLDAADFE